MKNKKVVDDSMLPRTPITIAGKNYDLCFDIRALMSAETAINAELMKAGRKDLVNLLFALPVQNLASTAICFAAALRTFHPEISYDDAVAMLTPDNVWQVADAIRSAFEVATPEAEQTVSPLAPSR